MNKSSSNWYESSIHSKALWDDYRKRYESLTFADRKMLAEVWYPKVADQKCFKPNQMLNAFDWLAQIMNDEKLTVVELGCWRGQLANLILGSDIEVNVKSWFGYDISDLAIANSHCKYKKFYGQSLDNWFHEIELPKFNTFVASHVFEHFTLNEIDNIIKKVFESGAVNLVLEVPLYSVNPDFIHNWQHYCGGHVLIASRNEVVKVINNYGYTREWEYLKGEHKAWLTVWGNYE